MFVSYLKWFRLSDVDNFGNSGTRHFIEGTDQSPRERFCHYVATKFNQQGSVGCFEN